MYIFGGVSCLAGFRWGIECSQKLGKRSEESFLVRDSLLILNNKIPIMLSEGLYQDSINLFVVKYLLCGIVTGGKFQTPY